ncbi:MAG TPA: adenylyltransferase/cytidyltransferase family protein [Pirellulales bacterium]
MPGMTTNREASKIVSLGELLARIERHRRDGRAIVFTNGCFDLLHVGHMTHLQEASALGDLFIVAVNSNAGVRGLKGPERPVVNEQDRALMLAALECVDFVVLFDDPTPIRLLERIRPDVLVKGGAYAPNEIVGRKIVESYGGRVRTTGHRGGISTSALLRAIREPETGGGAFVGRLAEPSSAADGPAASLFYKGPMPFLVLKGRRNLAVGESPRKTNANDSPSRAAAKERVVRHLFRRCAADARDV